MRPECSHLTGFIRGHCGSVAKEAPSGRATGAQWTFLTKGLPVHLQGNDRDCHHPAGQAFPPGTCLLRRLNP